MQPTPHDGRAPFRHDGPVGDLSAATRVAVLAAMLPELRPIVRRLGMGPLDLGGTRAHRASAGGREVVAAVTSMGTAAATDVTRRLLDAHPVDHVVVVGVAGAVDPGLHIGALVVPAVVLDEASGEERRPVPLGGNRPAGTLMTTDVLHTDLTAIEALRRQGIVALDMETAAIGAVAEERGIPWSVFRAISDRAGDPRVDAAVVGLSNPDGSPNATAVARFAVTRPHRLPGLAGLAKGLRLAVRTSTDAVVDALEVPPSR